MLERLRLRLRRLWMRDTYSNTQNYYETYPPDERKRYRLRRRVYTSPDPRRRYTYTPSSSDTSDSDPEDLYWIQSPRTRTRTFTTHNSRSNFITVDMDRTRSRGFWRSLFVSEYFDLFQRMKETRPRYEEERPRPRQPRDRYTYIRPVDSRYHNEYRWEGPRTNTPQRAPSPPRVRSPRWRGVSLPRRVVRSRSPEPRLRPRSDELPRGDVCRPQEPAYTRPRSRPARPCSPVNEREPIRRGRYTSPFPPPAPAPRPVPIPRLEVNIIQRNPRAFSPQRRSHIFSHPTSHRPPNIQILPHNPIRETRERMHSPELLSPPRSRKVRFVEGHEEICDPVYFNSDSDSSSDSSSSGSSSPSGSNSSYRRGPSRAGIQPRPRSRPLVVVQPQRESLTRIVERRPGGSSRVGGERRGLVRGSWGGRERERVGSEGVMYEYREPRGQGRVRDSRRYV